MRKPAFRILFQEFVQNTLGTSHVSLNDLQRSRAMLRCYIENVLSVLMPGVIPEDEDDLEACIVDGSRDLAVDFLARNEGRVLLIQCKFRGKEKNEKREDFVDFCDVLYRLHPVLGVAYKKNSKLQDAIAEIDWENDTFDLYYITLGRAGEDIRIREEEGLHARKELPDLDDRTDITFLDERDLNEKLREALSAAEGISGEVCINFSCTDGEPAWLTYENAESRKSFTGRISGARLRELYTRYRYRLFAMKLRAASCAVSDACAMPQNNVSC